ncbi:hypothetical protein BpHYR1_036815 [Brachionus plicatilis]|uniref:Uncharacterized protein n=1 Tax=Brachionus plicatilis TaxID=10195 RepID=A0A3M7SHX1_BRAPC|nr:hypothetical protein BpHYR1_036815 [Brachionus plicatilis]
MAYNGEKKVKFWSTESTKSNRYSGTQVTGFSSDSEVESNKKDKQKSDTTHQPRPQPQQQQQRPATTTKPSLINLQRVLNRGARYLKYMAMADK